MLLFRADRGSARSGREGPRLARLAVTAALSLGGLVAIAGASLGVSTSAVAAATHNIARVYNGVQARGELDCNGFSPVQKPVRASTCTDIRGFAHVSNQNTWNNRFYDNGIYIGHDEPNVQFLSNRAGSGNNVNWNLTLGTDPAALPTAGSPGSDVSHWFELTPAPWLSMAICDPLSYPQLPCTPDSNANAPSGQYPGGGSAVMEMQFYPPGNAPFVDSESCDNTHWCAALTIDSLACTDQFAVCNTNCEEPFNFAFIQTNGVPAGPPSPQLADLQTFIPNADTLMMNPGDRVSVHMSDAPVPGGSGKALLVTIRDLTTGQTGYMQASGTNGFQDTSIADCSGTPFNFEPEYSSAAVGNFVPWAAVQTDISSSFETGHFEPCTGLTNELATNPFDPADLGGPGGTSGVYNGCVGPYETAGGAEGPETGDALCYLQGDVHTGYAGPGTSTPPNEITGCQDNVSQNGDLDFDGSAYWKEWPTSTTATASLPGSFAMSLPTSAGRQYPGFRFQTDVALSETACSAKTPSGCTVPPVGPGGFYPYWSESGKPGAGARSCAFDFGNVSAGVNTFRQDVQYGTNRLSTLGYPEFIGPVHHNTCTASYHRRA